MIAKSTLAEGVIVQLEELIAAGEWPVGSRIPPEPELVRSLGVSRNTVREAVRALVHAGLLDPRPGDGTYVRADTGLGAALERLRRRWDALEVLEVRQLLERGAARLAAERREPADVRAIDAALAGRNAAVPGSNLGDAVAADVAFHQAVVAATHNRVLIDLYGHLAEPLRRSVVEAMGDRADLGLAGQHAALARAVRRGEAAAADRAATRLLGEALARLQARDDGAAGRPPAREPRSS
jgi:DNA-binding FadR family transcriptional regulator